MLLIKALKILVVLNFAVAGYDALLSGQCPALVWDDPQTNTSISFPAGYKGSLTYSDNKCPNGRPLASRYCNIDFASKFTTLSCLKDSKQVFTEVKSLTRTSISINQLGLVTKAIQSPTELSEATSALYAVARDLPFTDEFGRSADIKPPIISSDITLMNVFYGINNLINASESMPSFEENPNVTQDLRGALDLVAFSGAYDDFLMNQISLTNFLLQEISPTFKQTDNQSYADLHYTGQLFSDSNFNVSSAMSSPLSVTVPGTILDNLNLQENVSSQQNATELAVKFLLFDNDKLFPSMYNPSQILSINAIPMTRDNFSTPITLVFNNSKILKETHPPDNPLKRVISNVHCGSWAQGHWSISTCELVKNRSMPTCQCYAFGTFALLISTDEVLTNVSLTVISYVGMAITLILLMLTLFNILVVPELRRRKITFVNANICGNLIVLYLLTTFGIGAVNYPVCNYIAALIQYELLCSWAWITMNSYKMFEDLSRIFGGSRLSITKMVITGYFSPFVVVILNVGLTLFYLDKTQPIFDIEDFPVSHYRSPRMCWLHGYSLELGVLLPIGLMLIFNIILFISVLRSLSVRFSEINSLSEKKDCWQQLGMAVLIGITMGLSWIFAYLLLISPDLVYQRIMSSMFTIFVSLQGFVLFYLNCFRQRKIVFKWLSSFGPQSETTTNTL